MYCNNKDHTEGEWRVGLVRWKCCYQCNIKWRIIE